MYTWILAAALFVAWLVCTFVLGESGYVHILLLSAFALAVVQRAQEQRTAQR
ncbi:MAG TPA: DUF5670 family protein [Pyrinomonadaceae bacterium]|nr:DUF5670 family protein [Pyrinomonadaceae bacterium]